MKNVHTLTSTNPSIDTINNFLNTNLFNERFYNTFNLQTLRDLLINFIEFQQQSKTCNCLEKINSLLNEENIDLKLFEKYNLNNTIENNEKRIKLICKNCGKSYIL